MKALYKHTHFKENQSGSLCFTANMKEKNVPQEVLLLFLQKE